MADTYNLSDVFISYSRKDLPFARKLFDSIKALDKEVWADFEDIPKAADWWKEIQAGIDASDSFIFIISPDSVRSDICRQEVDHAMSKGKRFLPLLHRDIIEADDKEKIHPAISAHNWIFFREADDYEASFEILLESINTDLDHNRTLKRLLVRALEFDGAKRNPSYALRGEDLVQAQSWLSTALNKTPAPMALHIDYINFSLQQQQRQQRRTLAFMTSGFMVSLVLAFLAIVSFFSANDARADAISARDIAQESEKQAQISEQQARSLGLAASAIQALVDYKPDLALQLALLSTETDNQPTQITSSLAEVVYTPGTSQHIPIGTILDAVAYSTDGTRIAAGGEHGYLCIWEPETQTQQVCLGEDDVNWKAYTVRRLSFDDTGQHLLSTIEQGKLTLWNVESGSPDVGKIVHEYRCPPIDDETPCLLTDSAMNSDARLVVFGTKDGRLGAWNPLDDQFLGWFANSAAYNTQMNSQEDVGIPLKIALSSSGYRALVGYDSGRVAEWYIKTGNIVNHFDESQNPVTALAYSHNGLYAAVGLSNLGEIGLFNLVTGEMEYVFDGHKETVTSLRFHPNGHEFFSSSWDKTIMEWDVISKQRVRTYYGHEGGINTIDVSSDGEYVVSGGYDAAMRLWPTHSPMLTAEANADNGSLVSTAYNPTKGIIALGASDGTISLYKQTDSQVVTLGRRFQGYGQTVRDMIFTADGDSLMSLYWDGHLTRRDMTTGKRLWSLLISQEGSLNLTLLPDGKTLLVAFRSGWGIYDWNTGTEQAWIPFKEQPIRVLAAHPNGKWVAVGVNDRTKNLFLVDWHTGEIVRTYVGHRDGVTSIVFDEGGGRILTGSFDTDVRIWEIDTGRALNVFSGHNDRVVSVQFVPQTNFVISGSNDRSLRLWNIGTGFMMYRYQGHTDRVVDVFINHTEQGLISSGADGRVFFWALPPHLPEMVDWARKNRYIRPLTCAEAKLYLNHDQDCTTATTSS